jgi:hypothetical protein
MIEFIASPHVRTDRAVNDRPPSLRLERVGPVGLREERMIDRVAGREREE